MIRRVAPYVGGYVLLLAMLVGFAFGFGYVTSTGLFA